METQEADRHTIALGMNMISSPLKKYYEENIQKGYTIEQISNNLKNNGYSAADLDDAVSSLSPEFVELSKRNPSIFDYSSLPEEIKSSVSDAPARNGSSSNTDVNLGSSHPTPSPAGAKGDIHPGLDREAKIKFGVVLGIIMMVIVLGSVMLSTSSDTLGGTDSRLDSSEDALSPDDTQDDEDPSDPDAVDIPDPSDDPDDTTPSDEGDDADDGTDEVPSAVDRAGLITEADQVGLDVHQSDCNDYDCLIEHIDSCEGDAAIPHKIDVRPFSVILLQHYELIDSSEHGCIVSYHLDGYRRSYDESEIRRMIEDEDMTESQIDAEQEELFESDMSHNRSEYAMVCRADDMSNFIEIFDSYLDGVEHMIRCPEDASSGNVFESAAGIVIDASSVSRTCEGEGLWENVDCIRTDPELGMDEQFDALHAEKYGDLEGYESDVDDYRDTRGEPCDDDEQCFDGDVRTLNYCEDGQCRLKLDDGRECVSGDNFCPERCYGQNITDCYDPSGDRLCSENEHCDDDDDLTDGVCRDGVCHYFEIDPPNQAPVFDSYPTEHAYHNERYDFMVEAHDPDGGNITYHLEDEPEGMTINETTGELVWYPDISDYSSGLFSIVASDGIDETHKEILLMIYEDESNDSTYQACGDDRDCYKTTIFFTGDYEKCKYLELYWDDTREDVYECIADIAEADSDAGICDYIFDQDMRDECRDNI